VERYKLTADDHGMDVSYTVTDPVYLLEPFTIRSQYRKTADIEFVAEQCDPGIARRHLQFKCPPLERATTSAGRSKLYDRPAKINRRCDSEVVVKMPRLTRPCVGPTKRATPSAAPRNAAPYGLTLMSRRVP
jgi:hypothetical protein